MIQMIYIGLPINLFVPFYIVIHFTTLDTIRLFDKYIDSVIIMKLLKNFR